MTRKTLHRILNELIAAWENEAKVREIVILSAHAGEAHNEALGTIRSAGRVILIDIYGTPLSDLTGGQDPDTALLAWLAPNLGSAPAAGRADPAIGAKLYQRLLDHAAEIVEATS